MLAVGSGTNITSLSRNGTLFYHTSDTYTANDDSDTPLDYAKSALQVLIMDFEYGPGSAGRGEVSETTVLCRIVDKDAAKPSQDSDKPSSGAVIGGWSTLELWGIAMLNAIALL